MISSIFVLAVVLSSATALKFGSKLALYVAAVTALTVSLFMVWIALDHNPQGAYCEGGTGNPITLGFLPIPSGFREGCVLDVFQVTGLGLSWFVPTFILQLLGILAVRAFRSYATR